MLQNKIRAAFKLSPSDWLLLIQAWLLLLVVDLGLRALPFTRLQAWAAGRAGDNAAPSPVGALATIPQAHRMVDIASRFHLYPMTCLRRSLALQRLLARRGILTELRFGVQKEGGQLLAHAWLEHEGAPIGEPETLSERYATLVSQGTRL